MLETRPELTAQLDEELVGWLTTVTPDDQPQSSVVWFLRDADDLLVFSRPDATKLTNIATNPKVAFNLRGDDVADAVATFEATAVIVDSPTPAHGNAAYLTKYREEISRLGWTQEQFSNDYSALILISVHRIRSW